MKIRFNPFYFLVAPFLLFSTTAFTEERSGKKIEEVVVYGQKVQATVSDTSIAITAMDQDFLEDMGMQGPDEMVNFIPATTRTDWDVKIRGVGRNFRGLGGDPGVGVYFNGMYSPDFGIASTEGGLYDVNRIEVLRGPQGTLYGRNSIGGVINYVTNPANTEEFEASARVMLGRYATNEYYGFLSGPLTDDLAYRLVGVKRNRDGAIKDLNGGDVESINDQNVALTLEWQPVDNVRVVFRGNDRRSLREGNFGNGGHGITSEGPCVSTNGSRITDANQCDPRYRVDRDTNHYVPGFRPVSAEYAATYGDLADGPLGAVPWTHPTTGATHYGAYNRPGVDHTGKWPYMPTPNYMNADVARYNIGDAEAPDIVALTNGTAIEEFDHQQASITVDWDISDTLAVRYLGNYQNFIYYFNRDNDFSNSHVSDNNDTVIEDTDSWSQEFRVFWELGDRWTATSGFYYFYEKRQQLYGIRERAAQGRVTDAVKYGPDGAPNLLIEALSMVGWILPECMHYMDVPLNAGPSIHPGYGAYCGDPSNRSDYDQDYDTGAVYEHNNYIETENTAFYTQGDLKLTDTLSVTLGLRYSKDERKALEQRGGYSELDASAYDGWLPQAINLALDLFHPEISDSIDQGMLGSWGVIDPAAAAGPGVTGLAAMNVAMGNATWSGNSDFPLTPTCDFNAPTCAHPMRLEGIPISWGSRIDGDYEFDWDLTWRINFNWEPRDNILVYFGATSGYRAGGWNMGGPDNRTLLDTDGQGDCIDLPNQPGGSTGGCDLRALLNYDEEEITSYEIGYKGTHLDGRLQINSAIYYYDYKNYQDHVEKWEESNGSFSLPGLLLPDGSALGAPPGRGPVSITVNIPKAVNKGFEIDGLYLLTDNLTVGGNYSYTISEYDSPFTFFNEDDPRYPRNVFGGDLSENPCNMAPEIRDLYCLQINGFQLQGIPKHKATLWASYNWFLSQGTLTALGSMAYTGEYDTHPFSRPWDEVPERERLDLRVSYRDGGGKWSAALFVDNVLDKTYIRSADMDVRQTGYGSNWPQRVVALYPRFWGMEFTYNFGAATN